MENTYVQIIANLTKELATLNQQLEELTTQNKQQHLLIGKLHHQIEVLLREKYGKKSERNKSAKNDTAAKDGETKDDDKKAPPKAPNKNKAKPKRNPLPPELPREQIHYELPFDARTCQYCNEVCRCIGQETSKQLEFVPAHLIVKEPIRYK